MLTFGVMSPIYVQMEDTDEIFMLSVSSSDEKELAVELEDVFTSLGPLSDDVVEAYSMHLASALMHRLVKRRLSCGQAVLMSSAALDAALEVTGFNPSEVNLLEALLMWDLGNVIGSFLREGFTLLVHPHVLARLEAGDLERLGLVTMADRMRWGAMLGDISKECVLADARMRDTTAGKAYLELYNSFLLQQLPRSAFCASASSTLAASSGSSALATVEDSHFKGRSRKRTRKKKKDAARLRVGVGQQILAAFRPVSDDYEGRRSDLKELEHGEIGAEAVVCVEPEAEP